MPDRIEKRKRGRPLSSKYSLELGFRFPLRIGENLEPWRFMVLNQDIDYIALIDGDEGLGGKSHTALQLAYFLDIDTWEESEEVDPTTGRRLRIPKTRKFGIDQITFTPEEFSKAVRELPPFKAIVFDEAMRAADRRRSGSSVNIDFNQMMRECRQYNKFGIFVVQSIFDADLAVAVRRTRHLFHMAWDVDLAGNPKAPLKRGRCRFYGYNGKRLLYTNKFWRQAYEYPYIPNKSFDVEFGYHWVVDHAVYKEKKRIAEQEREKKQRSLKPVCPRDGCSLRFNHTKQLWVCTTCDWSGTKEQIRENGNS